MRITVMALVAFLIVIAVRATPARADVLDATDAGFSIKIALAVNATPAAVFQAITGRITAWWSPSHTFSGSSSNLTLDPRPGGCFCERLPGGGVQHMTTNEPLDLTIREMNRVMDEMEKILANRPARAAH